MNQISRYKILKRLGGGGFGEVFLGEDPAIGRQVAIKVFKPKDENLIAFATSSDEEGLEILCARFLNEAKILASLDEEPNIVGVLEYGELEDGAPFYVMPYLPRSLADELGKDVFDLSALEELPEAQRPRALPLDRALEILEQILTGLAAAHAKGLIHRDIKPSNLMLSESGQLRIVDFGIAKAPDGQHSTVSHLGLGSRNYMAPEQRESAKHVDARADVYSVGVVAYRMITGKLPIGRFADPNVAVPALGQPMNDLMLSMMAVGKAERPNDAAQALEQFQQARKSVNEDDRSSDTGTWVGGGEAGIRDELKPLRARIADLVGEQGLIRAADREGLVALAAIAELEENDLDRLIEDVIKGDKTLAGKQRLARVIQTRVKAQQGPLDEDTLASYESAAEAVDWDRPRIKQLMDQAVAGLAGEAAGKRGKARSPAGSGFSLPIKPIAAALAVIVVLSAGGYGVYEWRQGQIIAEQAERERAAAVAEAEKAWRDAQAEDTIEAYSGYLAQWPDGLNAQDARTRIEELEARGQSIIAQVQDYLNRLGYRVPQNGELETRTTESIKTFEEAQGLVVTGDADQVLLESLVSEYKRRDRAAWEHAMSANTETAYVRYRKQFPEGQHIDKIDDRIAQVREQKTWSDVESAGSIADYRGYLDIYPNGRFARKARAGIERIEARQAAAEARQQLITNIQRELQRLNRDVSLDGTLGPSTSAEIREFNRWLDRPAGENIGESLLMTLRKTTQWPSPAPGETFGECPDCPEMVVVPSGEFLMGSEFGLSNEKPLHSVKVSKFALAKTEITFDQWNTCVAEKGCSFHPYDAGWGEGRHPVINVSWNDAQQYVQWLSKKTGAQYRLATESEWEFAARAGKSTRFNTGDCIDRTQANFNSNFPAEGCKTEAYRMRTVPVASFPPNAYGLHDMHGNVWEWVEDCWKKDYKGAPPNGEARMEANCKYAVLRSGAWNTRGSLIRSAVRSGKKRETRSNDIGFRVARSL